MKMWQKIFIPHENVAKYFGTPLFHSTPVPGIKNDRSLITLPCRFITSEILEDAKSWCLYCEHDKDL